MRPRDCSCGARYEDLRTGLTFAAVRQLMWNPGEPAEGRWRRRSRRYILGFWHELKLQMWWSEHGGCQ